jgi:hypothetical protein
MALARSLCSLVPESAAFSDMISDETKSTEVIGFR